MASRYTLRIAVGITCAALVGFCRPAPAGATDVNDNAALLSAGNGPADAEVEGPRSLLEIRTGTESSHAFFRIGTQVSRSEEPESGERERKSTFTALSLMLAGPIDKSDGETDLATLDGLSNSVNASIKLNRFHVTRVNPFVDATGQVLREDGRIKIPPELQPFCDRLDQKTGESEYCRSNQIDDATVEQHLGVAAADRFQQQFFSGGTWVYGGEAKIGVQDFDYVDSDSLEERDSQRTLWSFGVHGGYANHWLGLASLAFRYERSFKQAESKTACPPPTGSDPQVCTTGPLGGPDGKARFQLLRPTAFFSSNG